jgi:hypothetical protein
MYHSHRLEDPRFSGKYRRYIVIVLQKKRGKYRKVYRDKYTKGKRDVADGVLHTWEGQLCRHFLHFLQSRTTFHVGYLCSMTRCPLALATTWYHSPSDGEWYHVLSFLRALPSPEKRYPTWNTCAHLQHAQTPRSLIITLIFGLRGSGRSAALRRCCIRLAHASDALHPSRSPPRARSAFDLPAFGVRSREDQGSQVSCMYVVKRCCDELWRSS